MIERCDFSDITDEIRLGSFIINPADKIITTFGSARIECGNPHYKYAYDLCYKLGGAGFSIMTGGGPGIMEASSKGAFDAGAVTYGINIELPHEQDMNSYIKKPFVCNNLLARKYLLMNNSIGFVIFQGGFGTLDELFALLTLISTEKIKPVPVVLAGIKFWGGLKEWINEVLLKNHYISANEAEFMKILDDQDEITEVFKKSL